MSEETKDAQTDQASQNKSPDVDALARKTQELLAEKKAEQAKRVALEAKLAEFEQAKLAQEEDEAKKRGEFEKLEAKLKAERDEIAAKYQSAIVGSALKSALVAANVSPALMEAAEALIRSKGVKIGNDDAAMIEGEPLDQWVKSWAATEKGKAFVSAPVSSGGGAPGGSANGSAKTMARAAFEALSPSEQMAAIRAGTTIF